MRRRRIDRAVFAYHVMSHPVITHDILSSLHSLPTLYLLKKKIKMSPSSWIPPPPEPINRLRQINKTTSCAKSTVPPPRGPSRVNNQQCVTGQYTHTNSAWTGKDWRAAFPHARLYVQRQTR